MPVFILKKWKIISGVIAATVGAYTLALQSNSATPSMNVSKAVISENEITIVFLNKSSPTIDNFNIEVALHYSGKIETIKKTNLGSILGSSGRRVIDLTGGPYKKADKIIICTNFPGPYGIDTVWYKFELQSSIIRPINLMHGIFSYTGNAIEVGHNYISGSECTTTA